MKTFIVSLIFTQMCIFPMASSANDLDNDVALLTATCKGEKDNLPVEFSLYSIVKSSGTSAIIGYKSTYNSFEYSILIKSSLVITPLHEINENTKSIRTEYTMNYASVQDKLVLDTSIENSGQAFIQGFWEVSLENKKIPLACVSVQQPRWPSP
ncbi:MAG: hypothetical protein HOP07_06660 [Bacteriovoracaceae bacterium]|nr:hypothetical protein [Bacteriovoracaceae bacterium]